MPGAVERVGEPTRLQPQGPHLALAHVQPRVQDQQALRALEVVVLPLPRVRDVCGRPGVVIAGRAALQWRGWR